MKVFDKFKRPFFRFEADEEHGLNTGEDMVFSRMAREAGYQLWCDLDLSGDLGHYYQSPLNVNDTGLRKIAEEFKAKHKPKLVANA